MRHGPPWGEVTPAATSVDSPAAATAVRVFRAAESSGGGGFGGRPVPHVHGGPRVFVFPYFYDPYYWYDPYYPGYPYAAYCDPYSPSYAPQYCYWDDGP